MRNAVYGCQAKRYKNEIALVSSIDRFSKFTRRKRSQPFLRRGLVCGSNNCYGEGFDSTDDCCEKRTDCNGGDSCCSNGVCTWGQGDCDSSSDCAPGFVCGSNNCRSMNGIRTWYDWDDDCCE